MQIDVKVNWIFFRDKPVYTFFTVCKILSIELESKLDETGKINDVIETGYAVDDVKPKIKKEYKKSELRLIETLDGICERILNYNIHKERKDSTRFAKGMSETFRTLHGLVDKGVKVDLGIPYELWDKPSAEVTNMKTQVRIKTQLQSFTLFVYHFVSTKYLYNANSSVNHFWNNMRVV